MKGLRGLTRSSTHYYMLHVAATRMYYLHDLDNLEAVVCVEYVRVHFDTSRQRGPCATTGQELCLAS